MSPTKFGINQIKFSKGMKIYAKGDKADFAYYVLLEKLIFTSRWITTWTCW